MKCCSPKTCAISCAVTAIVPLAIMVVGIVEKVRWTPFHREMQCDAPPPLALLVSKMSAPFPVAEALGLTPGAPPFGLFYNMTMGVSCTNPNQASVTMKAAGSKIEMFLPNATDLAIGGSGRPYVLVGEGSLARDAHFASGGGTAEILQRIAVKAGLADMLGMAAAAAVQGFAPMYVRTFVSVETCFTLFGLQQCQAVTNEEWCGAFGGSCLAEGADAEGRPFTPPRYEPAICGMTRSICGTESDMKAAMDPEALGVKVVQSMPCLPQTGMPNTTMCNVVTAPGVDPKTMQPRVVDPPKELTAQAEADLKENLGKAERMVNVITVGAVAYNALQFTLQLTLALVCCRRARRTARAGAGGTTATAEAAGAAPTKGGGGEFPRVLGSTSSTDQKVGPTVINASV